nr:methyl-accepting chemotaxis protein [Butyrivibrio sp.]
MADVSKKKKNVKNSNGGFGIKWRMLLMIVPVVVVALVVVSLVSTNIASTEISETMSSYVDSEIQANINTIDSKLESIRNTAENLSVFVSETYQIAGMDTYAKIFGDVVTESDLITGSGIWFEPNVYTGDEAYANQEYVGPYWYEDGASIVEDWQYSNAEYDYFSQEYYTNAKALTTLNATITDPYYDPSSGTIMASCSAPILVDGNYIGCITCDITLDVISELVGSIKVGNTGMATMITSDGTYVYCSDAEKYENGVKITEDSTDEIYEISEYIMSNVEGMHEFGTSQSLNAYFDTVPEVGWKLIVVMLQSEVNEAVNKMVRITVLISIIAIVLAVVIIFFVASNIAKTIINVNNFAKELASGDFTVSEMKSNRTDELGAMSKALNEMFRSNKGIISNISSESGNINDSASTLGAMSQQLAAEFSKIQSNMVSVNDAMMSTGAATEEVSASVQEVNTSVEDLARETESVAAEVKNIKRRASDIQEKSRAAQESSTQIA